MEVYALKLKQKSTVGFPMEVCKILEQLVSRIILGAASEKKAEEEKDMQ